MRYQFFLGDDAVSVFGAASVRERSLLSIYFRNLADFPESHDCTWQIGGVDFYAKRFGRWSITYRIDSPVRHVLITAIDKLFLR